MSLSDKFKEKPTVNSTEDVGVGEGKSSKIGEVVISIATDAAVRYYEGEPVLDTTELLKSAGVNAAWSFVLEDRIVFKIPMMSDEMSSKLIAVFGKSALHFVVDKFLVKAKTQQQAIYYIRRAGISSLVMVGWNMFKLNMNIGNPSAKFFNP